MSGMAFGPTGICFIDVRIPFILVRDVPIPSKDPHIRVRDANVRVRDRAILVRDLPILSADLPIRVRDRLILAFPKTIPAFPRTGQADPELGETGRRPIPAVRTGRAIISSLIPTGQHSIPTGRFAVPAVRGHAKKPPAEKRRNAAAHGLRTFPLPLPLPPVQVALIFQRVLAIILLEHLAEMLGVVEADPGGDLIGLGVGGQQDPQGLLHPDPQ